METPDPKYKHKPSEKHTLEEVLKSLQDLIRNDLDEGASGTAKPESPPAVSRQHEGATEETAEAKPRRENTTSIREDFAPVSPGSGPVNLDAVMRSLKDIIGNELNVGDEPKPVGEKSALTHEEYLAAEEKIEEYIPEELGRLDDELNIGDEYIPDETESTPPRDELSAPDEIIEENLTEEFTPLDEELTFEEAAEAVPPPPALSETPELPGEISPELFGEPEGAPPPVVPETSLAMEKNIAPGAQHEMFLEAAPAHSRAPEAAPPDSAPLSAQEPEPAPPPIPAEMHEPATGEAQPPADAALPTIEVEESFDANDYFDAAAPPAESPAAESEGAVALDAEISTEPEQASPLVDALPAATPESPAAPEPPPPTPVEKTIALEIASEPAGDSPQNKASVDFDALALEPSEPEQAPPSVDAETPALEAGLPAITAEPGASPAPPPETPKAPEEVAAAETEMTPEAEPPLAPAVPSATDTPPSFNLDDIPVLNEVVAPPAGGVPIPTAPTPAPPLPAPDRARDIVVRAVAKLNVEMRKSGGAGLDTRTILRLQQLIRQELEKGGKK